MSNRVSIVIPSRNEVFLQQTILDVLKNATGDIEIFPVLDGYEPPPHEIVEDPRVHYIRFPECAGNHKRQGVNTMVSLCSGKYVMTLDAHCMVAKGFDEVLVRDHQPNWVQVPRRNRLDAKNWCIQKQSDNRPPIDYEYIMYPAQFNPRAFHGFKWDDRTRERENVLIDDIITFQGSLWFMTKDWFKRCGFMDLKYQGWGQEAEEVSFTTWANGGECKVNKNTWYAHLHKGREHGRMYFLSKDMCRRSYEYCYNKWKDDPKFHKLLNKFMPMPGWPEKWEL